MIWARTEDLRAGCHGMCAGSERLELIDILCIARTSSKSRETEVDFQSTIVPVVD